VFTLGFALRLGLVLGLGPGLARVRFKVSGPVILEI
jgi:hypothetical protein